jgi:outer membrane cobalamin receptor
VISSEASYSRIQNWIQWVPKSSLWAPTNYKSVELTNAKAHIEVNFYGRKTKWINALDYAYSRALGVNQSTWERSKAFVMPYVPLQSLAFSTTCKIGKWMIGANYRILGKRFTLEDNSEMKALPMLSLADAQLAWCIRFKGMDCSMIFRAENIFNVSYQMVRSYAMPGRIISISMQCTIKSKSQKLNEKN